MKKVVYEEYRISGNKVTSMKLTKISLPENETLSMIKRYRFDDENTQKMLLDVQKAMEELKMEREQKEYEEMNYSAICRRLSKMSKWELMKELFK